MDLGYSDTTGQTGVSKIRRIRFVSSNQPPVVVASAQPTEGLAPLTVAFSSAGTLDPEGDPLSYLWTFGDGATSIDGQPGAHVRQQRPLLRQAGRFGRHQHDALDTTDHQRRQQARARHPARPPTVSSSGRATRSPSAATRPMRRTASSPPARSPGTSTSCTRDTCIPGCRRRVSSRGRFTIPTSGHDFSGNTRYRIMLTVTDSDGLQASQSVTVYPDKVNLLFDTVPSGLR